MRTWIKILIGVIIFICVAQVVLDMQDTYTHNCKPSGQQRMVNTIDGLKVEDQLVCDGGRTKWTLQYN